MWNIVAKWFNVDVLLRARGGAIEVVSSESFE